MNFSRAMVLAPHIDDGEFGCGGTIARLLAEGTEVYYVAFSAAEKSVPSGYPRDILRKEVKEACAVLGIPQDHLLIRDFPVRDFPARRQELLDELIRLRDALQPQLVLLPSAIFVHQEHATVAAEGLRTFKMRTILAYEMPWNNLTFTTTCFFPLEEEHIMSKVRALKAYRSQADRAYASEDFIRSLARTRGTQIGVSYAEAFEVVRWIV